ncbi:hypothetical protein [Micromonospora sp. KC721]|uniref:hypothetical protein n=1 Tax=Micromonospora sp. KC721 TaxID=2530380 RepID=UPI001404E4D1|nr:hypothetical protein [Micromonospora sp. KC721]
MTADDTPGGRLRHLADYLNLDWHWLQSRCADLGQYGLAGLAEPCSRLLSLGTRHWSGSRSTGRSAKAPPRRHAVSVCNRESRLSSAGSSPVLAATALISASRTSATARRVLGKRRGFATFNAGLSDAAMKPSATALL